MAAEMSLKEKVVAAWLVVGLLYAGAAAVGFTIQKDAWRLARQNYERAVKNYAKEAALIAEKPKWVADYEKERSHMPTFTKEEGAGTVWYRKLGNMAEAHHIDFKEVASSKEEVRGEVIEMPLQIRRWEGSLESLVRFVHDLENTDDGMYAVKALQFKPNLKTGYLAATGDLAINCAYMWKKEE